MQQHNQHEKFTCNENNLIRFMVIQIDENDMLKMCMDSMTDLCFYFQKIEISLECIGVLFFSQSLSTFYIYICALYLEEEHPPSTYLEINLRDSRCLEPTTNTLAVVQHFLLSAAISRNIGFMTNHVHYVTAYF